MSIIDHLLSLLDHFNKYLPEEGALDKHDYIRSSFTAKANHLTSDMEDALNFELSSDRTLRTHFDSKTLDEFWISVKNEYLQLSRAAMDTLMPFSSTYLCEKTYIKNKHRLRLNLEDDLRVAISKTKPRMDCLAQCTVHTHHIK